MSTTRRFTGTLKLPLPARAISSPEEIHSRNLALVREHFPDVFSEHFPALPDGIHTSLKALGLSGAEADNLIERWARLSGYKNARMKRLQVKHQLKQQREQLDAGRMAQRVAGIALLVELAPELFNYPMPVPLAIGIHREILALGILDATTVRDVLAWWTAQPAYRTAVAAGRERRNLDGIEIKRKE
jgi:ProQ/FINO family